MAAATDDPYNRSRDAYADAMGLRRRVFLGAVAAAFVSSVAAAGFGGLAWWEARQGAGRVERHIVRIDPQGAVVGELRVSQGWRPSDGDYIGFARRWVTNLRARPLDEPAIQRQRLELRDTTDRRVWPQIGQILRRLDAIQPNNAIDVEQVEANIFSHEKDGTTLVNVRWTERVRGLGGEPQVWSAPLVIAYREPTTTAEFGTNPVGIFVVDFRNTQVQGSSR